MSAGLLGAAPASGSPSRGMAVGLIWPGCTPHPLPTTGVSLLGLGFGPRQLVSGSLSPSVPGSAGLGVLLLGGAPSPRVYRGVRRLRASHPSALAVSGLLLIVWPCSVPCPVQHAWGGTVVLRQPGGWLPRFDRRWLPGCHSVTVLGARAVLWGSFAGPQRISMQACKLEPFSRPVCCVVFCERCDPWEDAAVRAGKVRTIPRAKVKARGVERTRGDPWVPQARGEGEAPVAGGRVRRRAERARCRRRPCPS